MQKKILVIYSYVNYSGTNVLEHLFSFRKYSNHRVYYLNLFFNKNFTFTNRIRFDAIFIHFTIFSTNPERFERYAGLLKKIKPHQAIKVAFFQDEWYKSDTYCRMINEFGIDIVFSVAPESAIPIIYNNINLNKVKFYPTLTGYLDERIIKKVKKINCKKETDLFYRTNFTNKHFFMGSYILHKKRIADEIISHPLSKNLKKNISFKPADFVTGFNWYKALMHSKYTLGIESGVNLMDRDGSIQKKVLEYLSSKPNATFQEILKDCYNGQDGNINYFAISPRNLQACLTKTCQILLEGEYNHILKPNIHYLEVKKDYSNLDEVMQMIVNDTYRESIVSKAYEDIVLSDKYTYKAFVNEVYSKIEFAETRNESKAEILPLFAINIIDNFNWVLVFFNSKFTIKFYRILTKIIPEKRVMKLRKFIKL